MDDFGDRFRQIAGDLDREPVPFALVGGWAVGVWSAPRFTKDVDIAVAVPSDEEAEGLVARLSRRGYSVVQALEHVETGRLSTVRLTLPRSSSPDPELDLLFRSSGIEAELVRAARPMTVLGVPFRVATIGYLIALKLLASNEETRPQIDESTSERFSQRPARATSPKRTKRSRLSPSAAAIAGRTSPPSSRRRAARRDDDGAGNRSRAERHHRGAATSMKTTVSVPDPLFEAAEAASRRLKVSRSRLYAMALAHFLAATERSDVTRQLNEVYANKRSTLNLRIARRQSESVGGEEW